MQKILTCLNVSDKEHGSSTSAHVQVALLKHCAAGELVCTICSHIGISGVLN